MKVYQCNLTFSIKKILDAYITKRLYSKQLWD